MSKQKLVIFGAGEIAELANWYFENDSSYEPVGFVVDSDHLKQDSLFGKPVRPFEEMTEHFPSDSHTAFVAIGYSGLNAVRAGKVAAVKTLGYALASMVSSRATVLTQYPIGENCFIFEDNTIQPFVKIGANVVMWSGNHIGHHSVIHDHTFITSHVVVSGGVEIGEKCFLGVNSTIRDHVKIGEKCLISAGALILTDCDAEGVYSVKGTERSRIPSSRLRSI